MSTIIIPRNHVSSQKNVGVNIDIKTQKNNNIIILKHI